MNNTEYEVEDISTEKTLHTSFGDYRPDIIVTTVSGKIFYFEIRTTNRKTEHYIPKWDELGNDVVEVDTRYFINQKCKNDVPTFKLIYSEGECFIKSYTRNDYDSTIALRKIEWKRQDKLNYKIQWERLDWFWNAMQKYKNNELSKEEVLIEFDKMDYSDMVWCFNNIKNKSCASLKDEFRESINSCFFEMLDDLCKKYDGVIIKYDQVSPLIYTIVCKYEALYLDYKLHDSFVARIKMSSGKILSLEHKKGIENGILELKQRFDEDFKKISKINELVKTPYIKSIVPASHWAAEYYNISNLYFKIEFEDYIHNNYIKETIGRIDSYYGINNLSKEFIENEYISLRKNALNNLDNEFLKSALMHNTLFSNAISDLREKCESTSDLDLRLRVSKGYNTIALLDDVHLVYEYKLDKRIVFGKFEKEFKELFMSKIKKYISRQKRIEYLINQVNSCKNKIWSAENEYGYTIINLHDGDNIICKSKIKIHDYDDAKTKIYETMLDLFSVAENYHDVRFLEEG